MPTLKLDGIMVRYGKNDAMACMWHYSHNLGYVVFVDGNVPQNAAVKLPTFNVYYYSKVKETV